MSEKCAETLSEGEILAPAAKLMQGGQDKGKQQ